ncbi:MAG: ABC transporter permease subunit [Deltaproteobacteria bacterium]|nr:ABC transporter permease/substrate-binding protein [Deltaproteobacteria bacterium]TDI98567.1 MAG: ABC transporter permease subunit [Deltaproteobacteria bacterium]
MNEQLALLPTYLTAHLQLSLMALLIGTTLSVPLGVWITRRKRLGQLALGVAGVIQTIPSLALLALMVPMLAVLGHFTSSTLGFELRSIGYLPALIALTLYSMLPILQTTVAGIEGVDPALNEAARGVGMTDRQRLLRVQLPLALPVIVAGVRTATVWVIGMTTLSTPVGATSLGNYIFSGLQTRNFAAVCVGSIAAALLAILVDQITRSLELGVRERRRGRIAFAAGVLAALYLFTVGSFVWARVRAAGPEITIGSKTFTEQYILSELIAGWVQRETGLHSRAVQSLGSTVLFEALKGGEVDVYVDYSGTIWATIMKRKSAPGSRAAVLAEVEEFLLREHGIVLAAALGFENRYALALREDQAERLAVETLSDLAPLSSSLEIGGDYEFFARPEWSALREAYGFAFRSERSMDSSLMYQAAAAGEVDVISAFSTDGRIVAFGLRVLEDDLGVIPPYDALILVGSRAAREHAGLVPVLRELEGVLDESAMQRLNLEVDGEGRAPRQVARALLERLR